MDFNILIAVGAVLATCLTIGLIAEKLRFPKVTVYLLVGLATGPALLGWISKSQMHRLHEVTELAMALVLFGLGCHFSLPKVRKTIGRSTLISIADVAATFLAVAGGLLVLGQPWEISVLLGSLAIATAPATTILVLQESASEGPITEHASNLVTLNNLASILIFESVFIFVTQFQGEASVSIGAELLLLFQDVAGAIAIGLAAGVVVSYGCSMLKRSRWLVLIISLSLAVLGVCHTFEIPYMLAFIAMGFMVANSSDILDEIESELAHLTGLLCVVFFAVHGAELDVQAFITAGLAGGAYILFRCIGKISGTYMAAKLIGEPASVRTWLGPSILAQAGAAIALSSIIASRNPELGKPIQTIILGSVVFFEIIGPFLTRQAVIRGGEVPISMAIYHSATSPISRVGEMLKATLSNFGLGSQTSMTREASVSELMRSDVYGIPKSATFDDIVRVIERSRDDTYPVVDDDYRVVGLICYSKLSNQLFDPTVGGLVRAEDLAVPADGLLIPDDRAMRAIDLFTDSQNDCVPVVSNLMERKLLGVIRRSDLTSMLIKSRKNA